MHQDKFLILGGGQQGKIIAERLGRTKKVTLADRDRSLENVHLPEAVSYQYFDAIDLFTGNRHQIGEWFKEHDVVVGALPSQFGEPSVALAAQVGARYVDLSFTNEDLSEHDTVAKLTGARIIPDCGLAPGLPNLIVGKLLRQFTRTGDTEIPEIKIYVGGVAKDKNKPYGYVPSWSLSDLWEEYDRAGRYVKNGQIFDTSPLNLRALETLEVPGVGTMEAFTSDGLRTLLKLRGFVPNMIEKTLRWPGHMAKIKPIMGPHFHKQKVVEQFEEVFKPGLDLVTLIVECGHFRRQLIVEGTESLSAMAKTTGYTCAAFADLVLFDRNHESRIEPGVTPLEVLGLDESHYRFIIKQLAAWGIYLSE